MIYGNTQSLFYELFYELILNPKLEFIIFICGTGAIVHNTGSVLVVLNAAMLYDRKI